ncbi:ankyrin repeat-containing domain protein [Schizophyllum commune]
MAAYFAQTDVARLLLDHAANHGREEIVRLLLEQGADVEECDANGCTPLHHAAGRGHPGTAALLLARGASIAAPDKQQDVGAHVDDRDEDDYTSLLWAAKKGHLSISRLLLERGASISARTKHHATPLTVAAYSGREEIGACVGDSQEGYLGIARLLLRHGATPLTIAAYNGRESIVRLLLDNDAPVEECNESGRTSLHFAAQQGHLSIVSLLLARGACSTPLTLAVSTGREDILSMDLTASLTYSSNEAPPSPREPTDT